MTHGLEDVERPPDCCRPDGISRIAAARRHQRNDEPMCGPCWFAWRAKNAADYKARKTANDRNATLAVHGHSHVRDAQLD